MNKDLNTIIDILKKELSKLKSDFKVDSIEIFGSYVRNEQTENSDLDILVTFSVAPDLIEFMDLEYYLSDLLQLKVDLVMRKALKPNIGKRIISEALKIV